MVRADSYYQGGNGGLVTATISVTPGETLAVLVGGEGGTAMYGTKGIGGYNGGGGSSFVEKGATHVKDLGGAAPAGNGTIVIFW